MYEFELIDNKTQTKLLKTLSMIWCPKPGKPGTL